MHPHAIIDWTALAMITKFDDESVSVGLDRTLKALTDVAAIEMYNVLKLHILSMPCVLTRDFDSSYIRNGNLVYRLTVSLTRTLGLSVHVRNVLQSKLISVSNNVLCRSPSNSS